MAYQRWLRSWQSRKEEAPPDPGVRDELVESPAPSRKAGIHDQREREAVVLTGSARRFEGQKGVER